MKMLHYNIHGWRDANGVDNVDRVTDLIKNHDPDVVSLVEVDEPWGRPSSLQQLADRLGHHWAFVPAFEYREEGGFGNALLSRTPFQSVQQWQLLPPSLYDGTEPSEPRALLLGQVDWNGNPISIGTTHFPRGSASMRAIAAARTLELLSELDEAWILAGDFNQPSSAWLDGSQHHVSPVAAATYPASTPVEAIDYCITASLEIEADVVADPDPSDHLALLIRAQL
ncbi:MAG: endonuclease/exonuclease/phosphatase family protein [Acidimicrobiales bacterium]